MKSPQGDLNISVTCVAGASVGFEHDHWRTLDDCRVADSSCRVIFQAVLWYSSEQTLTAAGYVQGCSSAQASSALSETR